MRRSDWLFLYDADEVLKGANGRVEHHRDREEFWHAERRDTLDRIKESGIEIEEHQITGGVRADIVIDVTLRDRLTECQNKLSEHQRKKADYEGWVAVLEAVVAREKAEGEAKLSLDHDDVRYFGLV